MMKIWRNIALVNLRPNVFRCDDIVNNNVAIDEKKKKQNLKKLSCHTGHNVMYLSDSIT